MRQSHQPGGLLCMYETQIGEAGRESWVENRMDGEKYWERANGNRSEERFSCVGTWLQ